MLCIDDEKQPGVVLVQLWGRDLRPRFREQCQVSLINASLGGLVNQLFICAGELRPWTAIIQSNHNQLTPNTLSTNNYSPFGKLYLLLQLKIATYIYCTKANTLFVFFFLVDISCFGLISSTPKFKIILSICASNFTMSWDFASIFYTMFFPHILRNASVPPATIPPRDMMLPLLQSWDFFIFSFFKCNKWNNDHYFQTLQFHCHLTTKHHSLSLFANFNLDF